MKNRLLVVLLLAAGSAWGSTIHSCVVGGQTVYSSRPCAANSAPAKTPKDNPGSTVAAPFLPPLPAPPPGQPKPPKPAGQTTAPHPHTQPLPTQRSGIVWWLALLLPAALIFRHWTQKRAQAPTQQKPIPPQLPKPISAQPASPDVLTRELEFLFQVGQQQTKAPFARKILPLRAKGLMSRYEAEFFLRLQAALPECAIHPQVPLAAFIEIDRKKAGKAFHTQSYRTQNYLGQKRVDYLVCESGNGKILAAIELDDPSHETPDAQARDHKKNVSLEEAGIPLYRWRVEHPPEAATIRAAILGGPNAGDTSGNA